MRYLLMQVKKPFGTFVKNGVYWVNETNAARVSVDYAVFYDSTILAKYETHKTMLLIRSAGIGDIIALSSLTNIADNTVILTQGKYKPLQKYFNDEVVFKDFNEPLFVVKYPKTIYDYTKSIGIMYGDEEIEKGSRRNWFEILSSSVDAEFIPEFGRPNLKTLTNEVDDLCLIVSKSSCVNRAADKSILDKYAKLFYSNVMHADEQKWTFAEYLQALDRAKFVISVDTSAIHFREGIRKPALGVYSSFTTDSRTKHYQYTKSIDIKSTCPLQPCFKHDDSICPFVKNDFAPCLSTEMTPDIFEQLIKYE